MMLLSISLALCLLIGGVSGRKPNCSKSCPFDVDACSAEDEQAKLFPGLFGKLNEINSISMYTIKTRNSTKFNQSGAADTGSQDNVTRRKRNPNCYTCQTEFYYSIVLEVEFEGQTYEVVQYDDIQSYQIITEGDCITMSGCLTMYKLVWMLIKKEDCEWTPAMQFVPVSVRSHCQCL